MVPLMSLNNASSSSVSSRDKTLPPAPVPSSPPDILQAKTLKRKNFKKLSLEPGAIKPEQDNKNNFKNDNLKNENLNLAHSELKPIPPSLRDKRDRIRPAPLLNLDKPVNPDDNTVDNDLMNHFSGIKLNSHRTSNLHTSVPKKRQTVISSISPTKSATSSPREPQVLSFASSSPMATTSSIKLNNDDLLTLRSLGSGNSGTVSKILHIPTQKTMAKKIIHIELKLVIQTQIIRELKIMHECRSPFIIDFYGAFIDTNNTIVICMEYCNCGSLDKIANICRQFPLPVVKKLAFAILSGLTYLYTTHKILHRDIKPSNVLMTHKGEFKLCDFGVLRELTNSLAVADTFVGTSTYMSPERIQGMNYGIKSDVWLMGLMLLELASGRPVWIDDDDSVLGPEGILDLLQRIVNETPPTIRNKVDPKTGAPYDPDLVRFIDSCLVKDEAKRKLPWELLEQDLFLRGVAEGTFDKEVKAWAKGIRKSHKDT
ncbi:mitogen-activated protein kinase kinase [Naganishia cerealis]|uniref:Mitogen-activated protein kinase kinase n=1 Tax=Naganishia cerealis TaxID=610337 RepID=A0ACC2W5Q9_9TREE|nr:mitogen-activated protein kinase kinase [Naganishia cerealis]